MRFVLTSHFENRTRISYGSFSPVRMTVWKLPNNCLLFYQSTAQSVRIPTDISKKLPNTSHQNQICSNSFSESITYISWNRPSYIKRWSQSTILKITVLSILALTLPFASAEVVPSAVSLHLSSIETSSNQISLSSTENSAVSFTVYTQAGQYCTGNKNDYYIPDGQCSSLPRQHMLINRIMETCRSICPIWLRFEEAESNAAKLL